MNERIRKLREQSLQAVNRISSERANLVTRPYPKASPIYPKLNLHSLKDFEILHNHKIARQHPEKHRDLIIRVAGYSDYFNGLGEDLQNEIIRRTEHEAI